MERRRFLQMTALLGGSAAIPALAHAAPQGLRVRHHDVAFQGAAQWHGGRLRVAQLSDIHVGWGTTAGVLAQASLAANQAQADLLVLTGDYLNHSLAEIDNLEAWLKTLPRPCVATFGNHDHWSGVAGIRKVLEKNGIITLVNESLTLDLGGKRLCVVGVDDGFTHHDDSEKAFSNVALPGNALVLAHEPRTADRVSRAGGRLVLSGHTHGGQVVIPGLTRALTAAIGMRYVAGWYQAGDAQLYVNAGVGASVAVARVGDQAAPELAVLDLA